MIRMGMSSRRHGRAALMMASLVLLASPGSGRAQDASLKSCAELPGTYVTAIADIEGVFASRGLVTFTGAGGFLVNDSGQGGTPGEFQPFSLGQGAWNCLSRRDGKVKAKAVALTFVLPSIEQPGAFGRVDYQVELDQKTQELSGTITLSFTRQGDLESVDPVKNPGPAYETFQFSGTRVTVP